MVLLPHTPWGLFLRMQNKPIIQNSRCKVRTVLPAPQSHPPQNGANGMEGGESVSTAKHTVEYSSSMKLQTAENITDQSFAPSKSNKKSIPQKKHQQNSHSLSSTCKIPRDVF